MEKYSEPEKQLTDEERKLLEQRKKDRKAKREQRKKMSDHQKAAKKEAAAKRNQKRGAKPKPARKAMGGVSDKVFAKRKRSALFKARKSAITLSRMLKNGEAEIVYSETCKLAHAKRNTTAEVIHGPLSSEARNLFRNDRARLAKIKGKTGTYVAIPNRASSQFGPASKPEKTIPGEKPWAGREATKAAPVATDGVKHVPVTYTGKNGVQMLGYTDHVGAHHKNCRKPVNNLVHADESSVKISRHVPGRIARRLEEMRKESEIRAAFKEMEKEEKLAEQARIAERRKVMNERKAFVNNLQCSGQKNFMDIKFSLNDYDTPADKDKLSKRERKANRMAFIADLKSKGIVPSGTTRSEYKAAMRKYDHQGW